MPTYEYQCLRCSLRFEVRRSFDDKSKITCPKCGGKAQQLFHPVPIFFKGGGFSTTYRG